MVSTEKEQKRVEILKVAEKLFTHFGMKKHLLKKLQRQVDWQKHQFIND